MRGIKSGISAVIAIGPLADLELVAAWNAVHGNTPDGWYVGRPGWEDRYRQWSMYAFDSSEKPEVGNRS